jgi:hypothetical protein
VILFICSAGIHHYLCYAEGREGAKRQAQPFLLGDPDMYTVTPLTEKGDVVRLAVTVRPEVV